MRNISFFHRSPPGSLDSEAPRAIRPLFVLGGLAVGGCSSPPSEVVASVQQRVEGRSLGEVYALEFDLALARSRSARLKALASRATGALLAPLVDDDGLPRYANDVALRGTCGVTLVSPALAVTAAHCVDPSFVDVDHLQIEMYRLSRPPAQPASPLAGTFPAFTHAQLGSEDGYFTDRYPCVIEARCGEAFGAPQRCPDETKATGDIALLRCDGEPGSKYGYLDAAKTDELDSPVFVPWKHELYALSDDEFDNPDASTWQHYGLVTEDPGENYHYFGVGPDDVEHNQLLPLFALPPAGADAITKLGASSTGVSTEALGCHGTSGAGVLQQAISGRWELLGPIRTGNPEHETYLCNHIPALDGSLRGPGNLGMNYTLLEVTHLLLAENADAISEDRAAHTKPLPALGDTLTLDFDDAAQRDWLGLRDLQSPVPTPSEARFIGDGERGFAALLLAEERLVIPASGLDGDGYGGRVDLASFTGSTAPSASCGTLDEAGNVTFAAPVERWFALPSVAPGGSVFIENTGAEPLVIHEIALARSSLSDSDGDRVADVLDPCPDNGLAPAPRSLATCTPAPLAVGPLGAFMPRTCPSASPNALVDAKDGAAIEPPLLVEGDYIELTPGRYEWTTDGATAERGTVVIDVVTTEACCGESTNLSALSDDADFFAAMRGTAACEDGRGGDDVLVSEHQGGALFGGEGSDFLLGRDGLIHGGAGDDYLEGLGQTTLVGGDGADTLNALGAGSAVLYGGAGADKLWGSPGADRIFVGPETTEVQALDGNDEVVVYARCELHPGLLLDGGPGQDTLVSPVAEGDAAKLGVTIRGFEEIRVVADQAHLSDCFGRRP